MQKDSRIKKPDCASHPFRHPLPLRHLGVDVHMAWMRAVCGRLKSDYRYSKDVVYNNFPWPSPLPGKRKR